MSQPIKDGGGTGRLATVSSFFRLNVSAKTNPRTFYASRDEGQTYNAISIDASADAGDFIWYLKNTSSTRNLYVKHLEFHGENATKWAVYEVSGTPSGTQITPSNLNLGSTNLAEALCYGNGAITGLTNVKIVGTHRSDALGEGEMQYDDALILAPSTAIAVKYVDGATGGAEVDGFFHYETIGAK